MGLVRAENRSRDAAAASGCETAAQALRREAQALGQTPGAEAELGLRLRTEQDPFVREALAGALVRQGSLAAAEVLVAQLRAEDAALRNLALAALVAMPGPAAALLEGMLGDPDPGMRLFGVLLAGDLPLGGIEMTLFARLQEETDANVCATLIEVLQGLGQSLPVQLLTATAQRFRSDGLVQFLLAEMPTLGDGFSAARS